MRAEVRGLLGNGKRESGAVDNLRQSLELRRALFIDLTLQWPLCG